MVDRRSLRPAAATLVLGELVFLLAGAFHPSHEDANNHHAVFTEYAHSHDWSAVHLGQFIGIALVVAGLLLLCHALDVPTGRLHWMTRGAAITAVVTLGLYAVLQAVDGIALKQAVDAWHHAAAPNKAATFASAETVRWLEWGVRSYQQLTQGVSLILVGTVVTITARLPRWVGALAVLAGAAVATQGLVIGAQGFSASSGSIGLLALALPLVWVLALAITSSRRHGVAAAPARQPRLADVTS